jgi:UDP-hydrolysing UDP-N-acetyl-D-glucosamine 2-epimerase
MKKKVFVVVTARPSYARVRSALLAMRDHAGIDLALVLGSSGLLDRYGDVVSAARRDGLVPAACVHNVIEGESLVCMPKTTGLAIVELSTVFENARPDVVVTIADRYETIATAIAASYMNIPLVHLQGGEVTGSIDEKVRHAVTKLSDLHLVANREARANVIRMGEPADRVVVTGCPSIDIASEVMSGGVRALDRVLAERGVGASIDLGRPFVVVLQHPVTTQYASSRRDVVETLGAITEVGIPALWFWPNVDAGSDGMSKGIREFRERHPEAAIRFIKNLAPEDFLGLLLRSQALVGNSSVAIRECSFLGVPAVDIGDRQHGRERGSNVVNCPPERGAIVEAIRERIHRGHRPGEPIYGTGDAGKRIAEIIAGWAPSIEKRLRFPSAQEVDS